MEKGGRISPRGARTGLRVQVQELEDVTLSFLTDSQVLKYQASTGTWINGTIAIGSANLDGGSATSVYGGSLTIDCGTATG